MKWAPTSAEDLAGEVKARLVDLAAGGHVLAWGRLPALGQSVCLAAEKVLKEEGWGEVVIRWVPDLGPWLGTAKPKPEPGLVVVRGGGGEK